MFILVATLTPPEALKEAVRRTGSQAAMAKLVGLSQPSVWKWLDKGKALPAEHVLKVEAATGVSRHDLRPDLYPESDPPTPAGRTGAGSALGEPALSGKRGSGAPAPRGLPAPSKGRSAHNLGEAAR